MNGEDRSGDGGGGGGGGGGRFGGRGGDLDKDDRQGDQGGSAGETGASWWSTTEAASGAVFNGTGINPSAAGTLYGLGDFAKGGTAPGEAGGGGYAVLEFEYIPLPKFKGASGWRQFTNAYIKFSGGWYPVVNAWIKVNNRWRSVNAPPAIEFTNRGTGILVGGTRAFSSYIDSPPADDTGGGYYV
jgi:hypothetical protein